MNLFDQVSNDIKSAMLAKDKVRLEALRGIKKEFLEAKTAKGADKRSDLYRAESSRFGRTGIGRSCCHRNLFA